MNQKYFLYLLSAIFLLLIVLFSFSSWKFLISSVAQTHEIKTETLQLSDIDVGRYNTIVKNGL